MFYVPPRGISRRPTKAGLLETLRFQFPRQERGFHHGKELFFPDPYLVRIFQERQKIRPVFSRSYLLMCAQLDSNQRPSP